MPRGHAAPVPLSPWPVVDAPCHPGQELVGPPARRWCPVCGTSYQLSCLTKEAGDNR